MSRVLASGERNHGSRIYATYCAGCHGAEGDGRGEAARFLYPRPRDFVAAEYKFSSRPTPGLPTDQDLKQVIRGGLKGTSMTGFPRLSDSEIEQVIAFLKTLSPRWQESHDPPLSFPEDPWSGRSAEAVQRGREVYHVEAVCLSCHPSYLDSSQIEHMSERLGFAAIPLREGAHLSVPRENADGSLTFPPDFRRDPIKTGPDLENLYRVISAGITTTAMPTWDGVLEPEQLWGLAHYIRSLQAERTPRVDPEIYRLRPPMDPSLPPEMDPEFEEAFTGEFP